MRHSRQYDGKANEKSLLAITTAETDRRNSDGLRFPCGGGGARWQRERGDRQECANVESTSATRRGRKGIGRRPDHGPKSGWHEERDSCHHYDERPARNR